MRISFTGIYDVRFPYGTSDKTIEKKYQDTKEFIDKNYNKDFLVLGIGLKDSFSCQKTDKPLVAKGIRITSTFDNPYIMSEIFDFMNTNEKEDLVQQYIDKSKVELVLNA